MVTWRCPAALRPRVTAAQNDLTVGAAAVAWAVAAGRGEGDREGTGLAGRPRTATAAGLAVTGGPSGGGGRRSGSPRRRRRRVPPATRKPPRRDVRRGWSADMAGAEALQHASILAGLRGRLCRERTQIVRVRPARVRTGSIDYRPSGSDLVGSHVAQRTSGPVTAVVPAVRAVPAQGTHDEGRHPWIVVDPFSSEQARLLRSSRCSWSPPAAARSAADARIWRPCA